MSSVKLPDVNKLPLSFRRCAINGCENQPYMLDPDKWPDGTEGNTTLCKEHWDKSEHKDE
jgi:hypothetical protein